MQYTQRYASPLGELLLAADGQGLTGLWFVGQRYFAAGLKEAQAQETLVLAQAMRWLDVYFAGAAPDFTPPLHLIGTPFRQAVWAALCDIPYGATATYGELARRVAAQTGRAQTSARAVGGAVGHNPISIIVPCHRVLGADGSLTGYAGGTERKQRLLALEEAGLGRAGAK